MTDDYLISSLVVDGQSKLFIYNTESHNSILIDSIMKGPDLINNSNLHNVTSDGVMCWGYVPLTQNETFDEILEGIETNGNEVLIFTKLNKSKI